MNIKCVVSLATSGLLLSPWMRSPASDVLLQDHQTSLKSLHHKHALVLSQAESAASQFMSEADVANKRVMPVKFLLQNMILLYTSLAPFFTHVQAVEAAAEAAAAAREARMFEVEMNVAKTEVKSMQREAEQWRRDIETLQSALKNKEQALDALKIEVAGLKASFKQITPEHGTFMEDHIEHQQQHASPQQQQFRPSLGDAEHWLQGATIAMASLPSPSPRRPDAHATASEVSSAHTQHPSHSRVFGAIINGNANGRGAATKQPQNRVQEQHYEFGAWPLQQQKKKQEDGDRNEHVVSWTTGGYSDGAAKKSRQQRSSSRGKLVFLR